jgi:hypothetical protein
MSYRHLRPFALTLLILTLLFSACARNAESKAVAQQFVQYYFVQDDLAGAAKLASGDVAATLDKRLQQIEAMGVKEPVKNSPRVNAVLVETKPVSPDEVLYVYRVTSGTDVEGMKPITARLRLSKEGNVWHVSSFIQEE